MGSALHRERSTERGHLLVGLMVIVAVMLIMLTAAAQSWTFLMRRDREAELIFRGEQYAKAIEFYQKENNAFPLELKALMKEGPHRHRYIRKLYKNPLQKEGIWGKLYLSPTGDGFLNPYATLPDPKALAAFGMAPVGSAPAVIGGLGGGSTRRTGSRSSQDSGFDQQEDDEGFGATFSEKDFEELERRLESRGALPIVGVVHPVKESGLKIYQNQANLNDWAFTMIQEIQPGQVPGTQEVPTAPRKRGRPQGLGDINQPFYRPGDDPARPKGPTGNLDPAREAREQARQEALEEARRAREEEEERRREEEEESWEDDDQAGDQDPNTDVDPNAEVDPNAPADPNDES